MKFEEEKLTIYPKRSELHLNMMTHDYWAQTIFCQTGPKLFKINILA